MLKSHWELHSYQVVARYKRSIGNARNVRNFLNMMSVGIAYFRLRPRPRVSFDSFGGVLFKIFSYRVLHSSYLL